MATSLSSGGVGSEPTTEPSSVSLSVSANTGTMEDEAASVSGSSYIGSDNDTPEMDACPWRTPEFHDQECSRYFDCPSHLVERALSDPESASDENGSVSAAPDSDDEDQNHTVIARMGEDPEEDLEPHPTRELSDSRSMSSPAHGAHIPAPADALQSFPASEVASDRPLLNPNPSETTPASSHLELPIRTASLPRSSSLSAGTTGVAPSNPNLPQTPQTPQTPPIPPTPPARLYRVSASPSSHMPSVPRGAGSSSPSTSRNPPEIVLPRWQPDSDVTICPICRTQFSFFVRKHHCRKCGRVVCNSCSPHRITIPFQYIVRPPGQARISQLYSNPLTGEEDSVFGTGGESVRLCNPCVPDPNTTPPQALRSPTQSSPSLNYRSQTTRHASNLHSQAAGGYFARAPLSDHSRSRSVTMSTPTMSAPRGHLPTGNQILAGTPPVYYPPSSSSQPSSSTRHFSGGPVIASSSTAQQRPLPPTPQIAEEDECPVCHRELPSSALPNSEALRESHITSCIAAHSAYGGGSGASNTPAVASPSGSGDLPTPSPMSMRRTGMFPYLATEKDCVDSAECTICLEEFEVGVPMARLECLCRFHRNCISAWFVNHPGRCPVHQHDSYGY